jgi:uncharacterized protein
MKFRFSGWLALIFFALFLIGCKPASQSDGRHVIINSNGGRVDIRVEVAETEAERKNGLMGRKALAEDSGMLFKFGQGMNPSMWMKNMLISLDLFFIGDDLKIKHIEENVPPCTLSDDSQCPRYRSSETAAFVLELPAGYTKKHAISTGNQVELVGLD